jgi:hypothetical protein
VKVKLQFYVGTTDWKPIKRKEYFTRSWPTERMEISFTPRSHYSLAKGICRRKLWPLFLQEWIILWWSSKEHTSLSLIFQFCSTFRHDYTEQTPWPESASELYRPSDHRLSAKLVPVFSDRVYHVVSVTNSYGGILGFLDRSRYFFFQVAPQLYSGGWVDPVPDPLLLRKSGSVKNRIRASGSVARNSDH